MMRRLLPAIFSLSLLLLSCSGNKADLVLTNGVIYTLDAEKPVVSAVACKGDKIVAMGSDEEIRAFVGRQTHVVDLEKRTVVPGFVEGHAHLVGVGKFARELDLTGARSYEEIVSMVGEATRTTPAGTWILGRGWHQNKWDSLPADTLHGFPSHTALSAVSPENPVWLEHASGHTGIANAKAMSLAGMEANVFPGEAEMGDRGEVLRNKWGEPTGIFNEAASGLIESRIPKQTRESLIKDLEVAFESCLQNGITSFHDAGADGATLDLLLEWNKQDKIPVRLYEMVSGGDSMLAETWFQRGPFISPWLTVRAVKLYGDGALGSRGAWLLAPYSDQPGHTGHAVTPMSYLQTMTDHGLKAGFQVCTHAIGDRANREVLDLYEESFRHYPDKAANSRFRIEHAQHIDPTDIPRFGDLGVIAAIQGIHHASDRPWAIQRLGQARITAGAYPWQSLIQSGAHVMNGTDAPVEPMSPIACFYATISRKTLKGEPEGGYEADQKMTREQALRSYTTEAAYGAFQEETKGKIATGFWADFTILSQDIMTIPEADILNTHVEGTIVGGKVAWTTPDWNWAIKKE